MHTVDSQTKRISIAKLLADNCQQLNTSMWYDIHEMRRIKDDVKDLLTEVSSHDDCIFHVLDINHAVSHLKTHKNDEAQVLLATMSLIHHPWYSSSSPDSFSHNTIVPIPKIKNRNVSDIANF
jgi:hypothetical protein